MTILTAACRFTGLSHEDCQGLIYLGSIYGVPTPCECECHARAAVAAANGGGES